MMIISHVVTVLLSALEKNQNEFKEVQGNINNLTLIKFLEATVVNFKDYEYVNTIGINIIKFMEV